VTLGGLVLRQDTGFPDDPAVRLSVVSGAATLTLRVRVPKWAAAPPVVSLNGAPLTGFPGALVQGLGAVGGSWIALRRHWRPGDVLQVTLPMQLAVEPTPDHPAVQALTYGPVVLSSVHGTDPGSLTPLLETASVRRTAARPMTFEGVVNHQPVTLLPIARVAHEYYTTYFQMV
jgi:hypothetical protein